MTMNKHWFDIAVKLKENKIAEPVLWIGDHNHLDQSLERKLLKILIFLSSNLIKYLT